MDPELVELPVPSGWVPHFRPFFGLVMRRSGVRFSSQAPCTQTPVGDNVPSWPGDELDAAYRRFDGLSYVLARAAPSDVLNSLVEQYGIEREASLKGRTVSPGVHQRTEPTSSSHMRAGSDCTGALPICRR
jgi:hypothetical protein